jgi:integrase
VTEALHAVVNRFIAHKKAVGRKYHSEEHELRLLVRFADERDIGQLDDLTAAVLEDFLASRPRRRPRSFNHLLGAVRCLLDWAVTNQLLVASPLRTSRRRVTSSRIPFLFDTDQARRLLAAAGGLPDNPRATQRGSTYRTIFALCYGLGLRAGEACGLRLCDADFERSLLVVRGGKFGKSRFVPHGPRIAELVGEQVARRRAGRSAADVAGEPLFTFDGLRSVHPCTASQVFHRLVASLDLAVPDRVSPPRLHDLRHSFAVGCLLRWYREGLDPSSRLHQLSTFMGHVAPSSTAVYLTITPELLNEANRRFEAFAESAWSGVAP